MPSKVRNRLSPSFVLALIALFAAIGGGAYAATVAKNSVTSKSVKNNTLKGGDILNESLTGNDVQDSSLSGADIENGSIRPSDIAGGGTVNGAAIVDDSVTGADVDESTLNIDEAQLDVRRVVARVRSTGPTEVAPDTNGIGTPPEPIAGISLTGNTYTRAANQTDTFAGQFTATVNANCAPTTAGGVLVDVADGNDLVASGFVQVPIGGSGEFSGFVFGNDATLEAGQKNRTLSAFVRATCETGASNVTLTDLKVNVEGSR